MGGNEISVAVVQMGARRGYEFARMLYRQAALSALYTDAAWVNEDKILPRVMRLCGRSAAVRRRRVSEVPAAMVHASIAPNVAGIIAGTMGVETEAKYRIEDFMLGTYARSRGVLKANVLLNTCGNGGARLIRSARHAGMLVVTDVVITPYVYDIVKEEELLWPGWVTRKVSRTDLTLYRDFHQQVMALSDVLLCPSATVADDVRSFAGECETKIAELPYGLGDVSVGQGRPVTKRILFAGKAGLRKGIQYLQAAANVIRRTDQEYQFRIAGEAPDDVRRRCPDLTFLGHLSREAMLREFQFADVFCLPSLAEGMASVLVEAMAFGVPCVVTRQTGAPFRNGTAGIIVPARDAEALTAAITSVCENRDLRQALSAGAAKAVEEFQSDALGARLMNLLREEMKERALA